MHSKQIVERILITLGVVAVTASAFAGSKVPVGRAWPANQQISLDQVDHSAWDSLLRKYVDANGDVNYRAWKATVADVAILDNYLAQLSRANASSKSSRAAQLAYWINAYNAVTLKGILREYPTSSIRNHTAKLFGYNIWDDLVLTTPAGAISLNHMEHNILRKMSEPRIHFAIVCASKGCPRLLNQAYTAQQLDAQLTTNSRQFFSDSRRFQFDPRSGQLSVSPILQWFAEDFGATQAKQMAAIGPFLPTAAAQQAAASGKAPVTYLGYDWKLNDQNP